MKESCKACEESDKACEENGKAPWKYFIASLTEKDFLEKYFFALLKIVGYDIVKAFFKRKAPEANANSHVFWKPMSKDYGFIKSSKG